MLDSPIPLIAGNWKMHGSREFAADLAGSLAAQISNNGPTVFEMLLCPPALLLNVVSAEVERSGIMVGGQDCHISKQGPHTGDIAAEMLTDAGCRYVIVGHSERRTDHGEDDALVQAKAAAAQSANLVPIICIGETLKQRDTGQAIEVVTGQLLLSIPSGSSAANVVIAYEPVWAIGTGQTPTLADIMKVHDAIRSTLTDIMEDGVRVRILYGGSVKPENASEILNIDNVNGALVGGASLSAEDFWAIAKAA
tara:strand:+ start:3262 stop:4017 length:756 start_codon:yes stop_codon:yes gene_type:complete